MIVTVIAMGMVEVTVNQIVDVIAMRHCFMTASRTMHKVRRMTTTGVSRSAGVGIHIANFHDMFFDFAVLTNMMQVSVMQVINVVAMLDASMFAVGAVLVVMVFVDVRHR